MSPCASIFYTDHYIEHRLGLSPPRARPPEEKCRIGHQPCVAQGFVAVSKGARGEAALDLILGSGAPRGGTARNDDAELDAA